MRITRRERQAGWLIAFALILCWLWSTLSPPGRQAITMRLIGPGNVYVALTGVDNPGCGAQGNPCASVAYGAGRLDQVLGGTEVLGAGSFTLDAINSNRDRALCDVWPSHTNVIGAGMGVTVLQAYSRTAEAYSISACGNVFAGITQRDEINFYDFTIDGNLILAGNPTAVSCGAGPDLGSECGIWGVNKSTNITWTRVEARNSMGNCYLVQGRNELYASNAVGIRWTDNVMTNCGLTRFDHHIYGKALPGVVIEGTTFHKTSGNCIQLQADQLRSGVEQHASGAQIRRNTCTDAGNVAGYGLYVVGYDGTSGGGFGENVVENNVFALSYGGVRLAYAVSSFRLSHNTIAGNGLPNDQGSTAEAVSILQDGCCSTQAVWDNNIITGAARAIYTHTTGQWTGTNNIVTGTTTGGGSVAFTNTTSVAPTFVSATDFHLQAASAGIDAASAGSTATVDRDSATRPGTATLRDRGAYEYAATVPTTTTLATTTTAAPAATSTIPVGTSSCTTYELESWVRFPAGSGTNPTATAHAGYTGSGYVSFVDQNTYLDPTASFATDQLPTPDPGWLSIRYSSTVAAVRHVWLYSPLNGAGFWNGPMVLPSTGGAWATVLMGLPAGRDANQQISIDYTPAAGDVGSIELDSIGICGLVSAPPTTAGSRTLVLTSWLDINQDGTRQPTETKPWTGALWRVRTDAGVLVDGGRIGSSGVVTSTRTQASSVNLTLTVTAPPGQARTSSPGSWSIAGTGTTAVLVGGCCPIAIGAR